MALDFDYQTGLGTLRWKPHPVGRRPVAYRVYGSDEKGFSVSDVPYGVNVGSTAALAPPPAEASEVRSWPEQAGSREAIATFPANFVAETAGTELAVLGPSVTLPGANKAYFRVVAVDGRERRSGASDYAGGLRPVIYSTPPATAAVGEPYRYQVQATRSLGDLRLRLVEGQEVRRFWDLERPRYALQEGPRWLTLDPHTGLLCGTPDVAGRVEVALSATNTRERRTLDEEALGWGHERVTATGSEEVGVAVQRFAVDVT